MKSVPHKLDKTDYKSWLARADAKRMLTLQAIWMQNQLVHLHGKHLLYHGLDDNTDFLQGSPVKHTFRMGLPWQQGIIQADAWMNSRSWPLPDQTLDVVVLQHSLDFTSRPHQLIREASRVLCEDGHLVIIGFNPLSWWGGLRSLVPFATDIPWVANMVSIKRLKDWLLLLGYSLRDTTSIGHVWPLTFLPAKFALRADSVLAGSPLVMGSFYMIVAQKTTINMSQRHAKGWGLAESQLGWATSVSHKHNNKLG